MLVVVLVFFYVNASTAFFHGQVFLSALPYHTSDTPVTFAAHLLFYSLISLHTQLPVFVKQFIAAISWYCKKVYCHNLVISFSKNCTKH